jgi:hypothetical protein
MAGRFQRKPARATSYRSAVAEFIAKALFSGAEREIAGAGNTEKAPVLVIIG